MFDVYHKETIPHTHTPFNLYVVVQILSVVSHVIFIELMMKANRINKMTKHEKQ